MKHILTYIKYDEISTNRKVSNIAGDWKQNHYGKSYYRLHFYVPFCYAKEENVLSLLSTFCTKLSARGKNNLILTVKGNI